MERDEGGKMRCNMKKRGRRTRGKAGGVSKFADDTKIGRLIQSDRDVAVMQEELNGLNEWSKKWMM